MRRKQRKTPEEAALALLRAAPLYYLATTTPQGEPVLRVLNGVVLDDCVLFHGALVGEKARCLGQRAVVSSHDEVAQIPSYFIDPKLACPATSYYRSVQARGILETFSEPQLKARMLQALMEKYQPEGGYARLDADDPVYTKELKAVLVFGIRVSELTGKASIGQDRPAERTRRVVEGLWQRGAATDLQAIELILSESEAARPDDFRLRSDGQDYLLHVFPSERHRAEHRALLEGAYWREGSTASAIERSIQGSTAWIGLSDTQGQLCAAGRAISDCTWTAQICDVIVRQDLRGKGLGKFVMQRLLDHPLVRRAHSVRLGTKDAMPFYERLGFSSALPSSSPTTTLMTRTA